MALLKTSRKWHRWLMLFLSIQFLIWSVSGVYMVVMNIDYIHGDSLVHNHQTYIDPEQVSYPLSALSQRYPDLQNLVVTTFLSRAVYRFSAENRNMIVDATTGEMLSPINQQDAIRVAKYHFTGNNSVISATLIEENPPFELNRRVLPAWRINFDDHGASSLYISRDTGKLVGKRHNYWRIFDYMFSFHVMDYVEEDPSNKLLLTVTLFALLSALFGAILSYLVIFRSKYNTNNKAGAQKNATA